MEKNIYGNAATCLVCRDGGIGTRVSEDKSVRGANSAGSPSLQFADDDFSESPVKTDRPDCGTWIEQLRKQPKSLSEEMQYRDCLTKALTGCCKKITEYTVINYNEIDEMISENCIVGDDKMYIEATGIGTMQQVRRLLSLVLLRDYRTLLAFLSSLLLQNEHVVAQVLREFKNCLQNKYTKPQKCTLCHLQTRVDMSLILDELLSYDDDWLPFYGKVSHTEYFGPSKEFWQELIGRVNASATHDHTAELILKALKKCGFHSDIVTMIQEDRILKRNCFACRCKEMFPFGNSGEIVEDTTAIQTPPSITNTGKQRKNFGKTSSVEQGFSNEEETDKLHYPYCKHQNALPQKTVHIIENINQENVAERSSEETMTDKKKDNYIQITLKEKQYLSNSRNVRQSTRNDSFEGESAEIQYVSHSEWYDYQRGSLKPCTHTSRNNVEILKDEMSGETDHNEIMKNTDPPITKKNLIQMELLKADTSEQDEEEMKSEHDWSVSSLASLQSSVNDYEWEVQKSSLTDPSKRAHFGGSENQSDLHDFKTGLPGKENDHERCEHQMAFLKIGVPEYENDRDSGFSPCSSMQSDVETSSEKRSLDNASDILSQVLSTENLLRTNQANEPGPETLILNFLIVFTFMICFFSHIVQTLNNIF